MISSNDPMEQQWLTALKAGDEGVLRLIFNRHYPLLLGDVYKIIQDTDTAKDIAQEVFVELWRKRSSIDIHTSLRAYLRRAAVNRALNFIKSNRKYIFAEPDDGLSESPEAEAFEIEAVDSNTEMESVLRQAIEGLPEKCRLVFSLSRFEQMSHKEIAMQLDISVKTIENQITKAMKILREVMIKHREMSRIVILCLNWWWLR
ncbi:MAG: RNA polymerase sigma-70 factor [Bacteroidota bacterium]